MAQGRHEREGDAGHPGVLDGTTGATLRSPSVPPNLQRMAAQAARDPDGVFTTLAHRIDEACRREASRPTSTSSAPGSDGGTAQTSAAHLDEHQCDFQARRRRGRSQAAPGERVWREPDEGGQRPIGKPAFEDKSVQRTEAMLLEAIDALDGYNGSYGFRPGCRPHEARHERRPRGMTEGMGWLVEAEGSGACDRIARRRRREGRRQRGNDGRRLRRMGKWWRAGVMEHGALPHPETGVVQGGGLAPVLAHVFRHHGLDAWCEREGRPRLQGRGFLMRGADDGVLGCAREEDARKSMAVLPRRFARCGLPMPPTETTRMAVRKPEAHVGSDRGERHLRRCRMDPLRDDIAPGVLGEQTQDSQETAASHQEVARAMVSHPSSRTAALPVPDALREARRALPRLW